MERMKDNFISMVTHELRTPLTGILLISKQLQQYYRRMSEEQILNKVEQLHMQSEVMAELVESILDISRLEARQSQTPSEHVDMLSVVQGIVAELLHLASEKQQSLALFHDPIAGTIEADAVDLARIWRNLIGNAIKYTSEGGNIEVRLGTMQVENDRLYLVTPTIHQLEEFAASASPAGRYCVGQVQDTGLGIAAEDLPHVFERFHRGRAKQYNIPGTGLGLALVNELLTHYRGAIHIASQLGQGTTVTFWMPLVEEHEHG
jgi:signal transduction histidine kinase